MTSTLTTHPGPASRAVAQAKDPWVLLASAIGGGVAWAIGIPVVLALVVAVGMLAGAATIGAFTGPRAKPGLELRSGTPQGQLVKSLAAYLKDLRALRGSKLPDAVIDSSIEALVAADGAHQVARQVAAAVDALDDALARTSTISRSTTSTRVRDSVARMTARRQALLDKLTAAVAEVAEVYTKVVELSATADAFALGAGAGEVTDVNSSLDSLLTSFAELEQAAAKTTT